MNTRMKIGLIALLGLTASQLAIADEPPRRGWWFDIGAGPASLSTGSGAPISGSGTLLDTMIGGRINEHWLMGLQLGGTSSNASNNNEADLGGTLSHAMLAFRYLPKSDHGWIWGLGAGPVSYNNYAIELYSGNYNSGHGWAGNAALGYDWKIGKRSTHIETMLNVEQGHISLGSPLAGAFSYTLLAASVHFAWY